MSENQSSEQFQPLAEEEISPQERKHRLEEELAQNQKE